MRIAALAFGVVAGLIASLILALGGLDVTAAATAPDRQIQITRFALFILANIGVFGAGLVVASPLGGAILFVVGAVCWVIAALLLHHGIDLVLVVPPLLLLMATGFSAAAFFSRASGFNLPPITLGRKREAPDAEDFDDLPPTPVGAGFYASSIGEPAGHEDEPRIDGLDGRDRPPVDWTPGKRRAPPPRQKPMFRPPEDDEYEESGFSRLARGVSSVLSFGLYAAVGAALLLVFWNARSADTSHPAAAKLEPTAVAEASVSTPAPVSVTTAESPSSALELAAASEAATAAASAEESGAAQQQAAADSTPSIPPQLMAGVVVADPGNPVSFEAPRDILGTALSPQTQTQPSDATDSAVDDSGASSASADDTTDASVVMPFPMPLSIAASRNGPSSRPAGRPAATPAAPHGDVGL